jgi:hypothetical protein
MKKLLCLVLMLSMILIISCKEEGSGSSSPTPQPKPWTSPPSNPSLETPPTTPAGICILVENDTVDQYMSRWESEGFVWSNIDWASLDRIFEEKKEYYCTTLNWNCREGVTFSNLTVYIKPWCPTCVDEESPLQPYEIYEYINGQWQCIDGWYYKNVVYIHLGDDPGQDHDLLDTDGNIVGSYKAFEESSYSHELLHFFQEVAGLPFSDDTYIPGGTTSGYTIILPSEEEDEKDENQN